jgi:Tfp pilus assembly protein PilF
MSWSGSWRDRRLRLAVLLLALAGLLTAFLVKSARDARLRSYRGASLQALARQDFTAAQDQLNSWLAGEPDNAEAHLLMAQALRRGAMGAPFQAGWDKDIRFHLRECSRLGLDGDELLLQWQLVRALSEEFAVAERPLLDRVLKEDPQTPQILEVLTRANLDNQQPQRAFQSVSRLLALEPDHVLALYWRGITRELLLEPDGDVAADYRRAIELDPGRDEIRQRLAVKLLELNQPNEARPHWELLMEHEPGDLEVALGLACCRHAEGRLPEARELLDRVLAAQPENSLALLEKGKLELTQGNVPQAEGWLRKAVAAVPNDSQANFTLSRCLEQAGRAQEARTFREKSESASEDWKRLRELTNRIGTAPADPAPRYEAGLLLLQKGKDTMGVDWLESALHADPSYVPAHRALMDYYERIGKQRLAAGHRRFVELARTGPGSSQKK